MKLRTDRIEDAATKSQVQAKPNGHPLASVRTIDIDPDAEYRPTSIPFLPPSNNQEMKLPNLKDIGRVVTKVGTIVPNPISTAVNVVNKTAEALKPKPGLTLPPPPVDLKTGTQPINPPQASNKLMDFDFRSYITNMGIQTKHLIWVAVIGGGLWYASKNRWFSKLKRKVGMR